MIRLPITLGGAGSVIYGPGFGMEVVDVSPATHTVRVRIAKLQLTRVSLQHTKDTIRWTDVESGTTNFDEATVFCAEGTWPYVRRERNEDAVFEVTYALARGAVTVNWSAEGQSIPNASGTLTFWGKQVEIPNALLGKTVTTKAVRVEYTVEPIPLGSRLVLKNRPVDATFDVHVNAVLTTAVGSGSADDWMEFVGQEYVYPQEFIERREACIEHFRQMSNRYRRYKILFPPDLWRRVPEEQIERVNELLQVMAKAYEAESRGVYDAVLGQLSRLTGIAGIEPIVVSRAEPMKLHPQMSEREPEVKREQSHPRP
jgi:hypothetical protein